MNKDNILELLKSKNRNFRLPKHLDFSIDGKVLTISLSMEGLTSNMQTDDAAFEGWAICLKAWIPDIQNVIIQKQTKELPANNEHYNRFLYRVMKFTETYPWAEAKDFNREIETFKANKLVVNVPLKEADKDAGHAEAKLEREFCLKEKENFDALDHQLPVHLFNGKVCDDLSLTPSSFLDIWSIKDGVLNIYELKLPTNKKVGIISELMFYVNVMADIMTHNIVIPNTSVYRSFNHLYEMQEQNKCKQINGVFLTNALHSMIEQRKEEVITILNEGKFAIPTKFTHQTFDIMQKEYNKYPQTKYQTQQESRQRRLMRSKSDVFDGADGELFFIKETKSWRPSSKIIRHSESSKNLFKPIRQAALAYFELNDIEWWRQSEEHYFPNGHVLSSQIHCLNHLFAIRADQDAVLKIIQAILPEITEILPSPIDEQFCIMEKYPYKTPSYISFEFTCYNKLYLNERCNKRGANCTSVDAFVYAKDQEGKHVLIPIEWKYTEHYEKVDDEYKADEEKVEKRYRHLAELSDSNLKGWKDAYYWDPAYELARQTLLMEQIIRNKPFHADYYQHIVVCPNGNVEMRTDANAFKESLTEKWKEHFHIIDPQELLASLEGNEKYSKLLEYLRKRYW